MSASDVLAGLKELKALVVKYGEFRSEWTAFSEKVQDWEQLIFCCDPSDPHWQAVVESLKNAKEKLNTLCESKRPWYHPLRWYKATLQALSADEHIAALKEVERDVDECIKKANVIDGQNLSRQVDSIKDSIPDVPKLEYFGFPQKLTKCVLFRAKTVSRATQAVLQDAFTLGIVGVAGVGKSSMLDNIRSRASVHSKYGDRVWYYNRAEESLRGDSEEEVSARVRHVLSIFYGGLPGVDRNVSRCLQLEDLIVRINERLKDGRQGPWLFVVDDVWTDKEVQDFSRLVQGTQSSMVYTSRDTRKMLPDTSSSVETIEKRLDKRDKSEMNSLVEFAAQKAKLPVRTAEDRLRVMEMAENLNYFPFDMATVWGSRRPDGVNSWQGLKQMFDDRGYEKSPITAALKVLEMSEKANGRRLIRTLFRLAILPHGSVPFREEDAQLMFGADVDVKTTLEVLSTSSVLSQLEDKTYEMHDIYLGYLQSEAGQRALLQESLSLKPVQLESVRAFFKRASSNLNEVYTPFMQLQLSSLLDSVDQSNLSPEICHEFAAHDLAASLYSKGSGLYNKASYSSALPLLKAAVFTARHGQSINISRVYCLPLKFKRLLRRTVLSHRKTYEGSVPPLLNYLDAQGRCCHDMGLYENAFQLFVESKEKCRELLGRRHSAYATSLNNLAELLRAQVRLMIHTLSHSLLSFEHRENTTRQNRCMKKPSPSEGRSLATSTRLSLRVSTT